MPPIRVARIIAVTTDVFAWSVLSDRDRRSRPFCPWCNLEHIGFVQIETIFPIWADLWRYRREWLTHDLLAGLGIAAIAIPIAIAYPAIAGLPPATGLYATIFLLVAYALFGSSRQLIVGPDTAVCTVLASSLVHIGVNTVGERVALATSFAVVVGVRCLLANRLRLGFIADFLSRPMLTTLGEPARLCIRDRISAFHNSRDAILWQHTTRDQLCNECTKIQNRSLGLIHVSFLTTLSITKTRAFYFRRKRLSRLWLLIGRYAYVPTVLRRRSRNIRVPGPVLLITWIVRIDIDRHASFVRIVGREND